MCQIFLANKAGLKEFAADHCFEYNMGYCRSFDDKTF